MGLNLLKKVHVILLCLGVGFILTGCGGGGGSGSSEIAVSQGTLSTSLTDSSTDEYQAVYVTIARIDVHHDESNNWETVARPNKTYNLLELVNGVRETLGITSLTSGHYTQMRLIIGETPEEFSLNILSRQHPYANYIINLLDEVHELKVPGGMNTGLKIVNGFDINENQTTELLLDFDAMRSVVKAGSSGKYLLKPTIKVLDTADHAMASGVVSEADTVPTVLLGGALVTAQSTAPANPDAKEQVVIEAGTLADPNGEYSLFLAPGGYNLVTAPAGYLPGCTTVSLQAGSTTMFDFSLLTTATNPGTISGTVTLANAPDDQYVTIDFRQEVTCVNSSNTTLVTARSINVANGGAYSVELPAGDYQAVISTFSEATQTADVTVESDTTTLFDITF